MTPGRRPRRYALCDTHPRAGPVVAVEPVPAAPLAREAERRLRKGDADVDGRSVIVAIVLLARNTSGRSRSGVEGVRPGMQVYGSDGQPIGVVDKVESNGLLVGGEFVPGNTITGVERDRVLLAQGSIAFTRGEQRGDRDTPGTGPAPSDGPGEGREA